MGTCLKEGGDSRKSGQNQHYFLEFIPGSCEVVVIRQLFASVGVLLMAGEQIFWTSCVCPNTKKESKNIYKLLLLMVSAVMVAAANWSSANAATYYLDAANGNNNNTGTSAQPWKTINRAKPYGGGSPQVVAGDTVYLRGGYYGQLRWISFNNIGADWVTYIAEDINDPPLFQNITIGDASHDYDTYLSFDGLRFPWTVDGNNVGASRENKRVLQLYPVNHFKLLNSYAEGSAQGVFCYLRGVSSGTPADDITFDACTAYNFGWLGMAGQDVNSLAVSNCSITHIKGCDGVIMFENLDNSTIAGCTLGDAYLNPSDPGVHRDIIQLWSSSGYCSNITIRGNIFYDSQQYVFLKQMDNVLIENNLFRGTVSTNHTCTIHDNSTGGTVRNNTIVTTGSDVGLVFTNNPGATFTVANNIIDGRVYSSNGGTITYKNNVFASGSGFDETNHVYSKQYSYKLNTTERYSLWVDADGGLYSLNENSRAVNFGSADYAPDDDILGNHRDPYPDAGCYEYVVSNCPPVLDPIGDKYVDENSPLSFTVSADDADGDTIIYSATGLPGGSTFTDQTFSWTPGYDQAGDYQVTFIADDGQDQDSETITITANNTNRPPVLASIGDKSVYLGDSLGFTISAIDPDGDKVTYSVDGLPDGAMFEGQSFSWTPNSSQVDSYDVTFTASDSQSEDSEQITITVAIDSTAPAVSGLLPAADSIQVPLNSLISLYITDGGRGVDADTVTIELGGNLVYSADTEDYISPYGHCCRVGTRASYRYFYQANELFDYDQSITITVNASDVAGNDMPAFSYSFRTQMRSFGANKEIVPDPCDVDREITATALDSSGNVWVVWHEGQTGGRNIRLARLADGADAFSDGIELTNDNFDQCNADIAIDSDDKLYVVWQGDNEGNWDIYMSTSTDGISWSTQKRITDSNDDQINPAVAVDGSVPATAYVVWEDDRNGNGDIYGAGSSDDFLTSTTWEITSEQSEQSEPAIAVDANNAPYVVWTDEREGSKDIYGASFDNDLWTNLAVVSDDGNACNQLSPAIATEDTGSRLHLLWADDSGGDYDIFYANTSGGLPSSPLTGNSIIDDTTDADQLSPAIAVSGITGDNLHVFACWLDERNSDTDLYFVQIGSGSQTNIFVGDGNTNSNQDKPVIGLDKLGYPYLVWTDDRNGGSDIYYAASTYIDPQALAQKQVSAANGAVIGVSPAQVSRVDDVSVSIPSGAWQCDLDVEISKIRNVPEFSNCTPVANYDIGPSGINFDEPVTVIIPYNAGDYPGPLIPYCYGPQEHNPSRDGITAVEKLVISPSIHAIRFLTTHFSQFILASDTNANEPNVAWRFGTFGDRRNVKLVVTGLDACPLNLSLWGSGYGEVIQADGLSRIVLYDTTRSTSLRISSKNLTSGSAVGDIVINGSLRNIRARRIDLEGDLTISGNVGKVTLGNVSDSNITIGSASNPRASVSFRLGRVSDSSINSQIPIRRLTAIDWLDNDSTADQITAPSIGKLKITGRRRGNVAGDFNADIILTGNMGKALIAGSLVDSDWSVDGHINSLVVRQASENSYVCSTGSIASISLGAAYDSDFLAGFDPDCDELWPAAVSGFLTIVARINSFVITGLRTQPGEYYFVNTNVSAPSIGRVHLLNLQTQNSGCDFGMWTLKGGAGDTMALVSNRNTVDSDESFTVKRGDGIPGNIDDFWMKILEP